MGPALTGGLGGSSRTARATTRAKVCPPTPAHACASRLVEPSALTHMLTRVCAPDAQVMPAHRHCRHRRYRRRHCRRLRCHRAACRCHPVPFRCMLSVASVCAVAGPRQRTQGAERANFGRSFVGGFGAGGDRWGGVGPFRSILVRFGTYLYVVLGPAVCPDGVV